MEELEELKKENKWLREREEWYIEQLRAMRARMIYVYGGEQKPVRLAGVITHEGILIYIGKRLDSEASNPEWETVEVRGHKIQIHFPKEQA